MSYSRPDRQVPLRLLGNRKYRRMKFRTHRIDGTAFTQPSLYKRVQDRRKRQRSR